jgi:hypothetical protein
MKFDAILTKVVNLFVQFDYMSKLINNQIGQFNHVDWSKNTHVIQAPSL